MRPTLERKLSHRGVLHHDRRRLSGEGDHHRRAAVIEVPQAAHHGRAVEPHAEEQEGELSISLNKLMKH